MLTGVISKFNDNFLTIRKNGNGIGVREIS